MKRIAAIAFVLAAAFVTAESALAQEPLVNVTVPFSFTVGASTLPAGTYSIRSTANAPSLLTIQSWDNHVGVMTLGLTDQTSGEQANKLVFHKYGDQYFLSEIRTANSASYIYFAKTKAEKRARTQSENAGLRIENPVLIALK